MYVHIGEEILIRTNDIVAILDKHSVDLNEVRKSEQIEPSSVHLANKNVKSVIITKDKIYLSSIASGTLKKRSRLTSLQDLNGDCMTN